LDLRLYFRVIWRFRLLVGAGFLLAILFTTLSIARIDFSHGSPRATYRQEEQWSSTATLLVTQLGFPLGRAEVPDGTDTRFAGLANIYADLASSDPIRRIIRRMGPLSQTETIQGYPTTSAVDQSVVLPLVNVSATATSPTRAFLLTERASAALRSYIEQQQSVNGIPQERRIILDEVKRPQDAKLVSGRSKTLPIVVFITVMMAFIGLAFMLENVRPRVHVVDEEPIVERVGKLVDDRAESRTATIASRHSV
jgi:hypothetical protein